MRETMPSKAESISASMTKIPKVCVFVVIFVYFGFFVICTCYAVHCSFVVLFVLFIVLLALF